jgi:hypothetical protein
MAGAVIDTGGLGVQDELARHGRFNGAVRWALQGRPWTASPPP